MLFIAHSRAGSSPSRCPAASPRAQADRHRDLAQRIRRLGTGGRHNAAERFILEKLAIAREVELLGAELAEGEK